MSIDYFKFGNGKKNMVILPGVYPGKFLPLKDAIIKQYAIFTNEYTIYLFDRNDIIYDCDTFDEMAKQLIYAINQLNLKELYLYGVSYGGMLALNIAINNPQLIKKLAICSSTDITDKNSDKIITNWYKLSLNKADKQLANNIVELLYHPNTIKNIRESLVNNICASIVGQHERFAFQCQMIIGYDERKAVSNLNIDARVFASENDKIFPIESIKTLAKDLHCQIKIYDGPFGHAVYDENPELLNDLKNYFDED